MAEQEQVATAFSEVGNVLNELFMKYQDDLGGRVQIAVADADAAFEKIAVLEAWARDRREQYLGWSDTPQRGSVDFDVRRVLEIIGAEVQP